MAVSDTRKVLLEVLVLICCVAVSGVLANCVNGGSSVEERTSNVPLVIKGIVVARSHTGTHLTIRVGKVLKGGNESVSGTEIDLIVPEMSEETTATAPVTNANGNGTTVPVSPGYGHQNNATTTVTSTVGQAVTTAPCLDGVRVLTRYIFFLRPLDNEGSSFEVAEDGVPQTRDNLRKIRQTVSQEQEVKGEPWVPRRKPHDHSPRLKIQRKGKPTVNDTLPEDDHSGPCTDPTYIEHYCLNGGTCGIWKGVEKYFCICNYPYHGQRCSEVDPALSGKDEPGTSSNETTLAIAVIMSAFFIITVICAVAYIKYKNSIWRERKREVEKTLKYMQERYPSRASSRRESPVEGAIVFKTNSTNANGEGAQQVIIFQDPDGRQSRQGSLGSSQYRLLSEALGHPHRASIDLSDRVPPLSTHHVSSRTSIV